MSNVFIESLLPTISIYFAIFCLASLAGVISERAGVINVGIDGMMVIGATGYSITAALMWSPDKSDWLQIFPLFIGILLAGLFALLHAFASIKLKANQIISGTAINLFAQGLGLFLATLEGSWSNGVAINSQFGILSISNTHNILTLYLFITIIITALTGIYFSFTRTGARHISAGENPHALDAAGINVIKYRYMAVFVSGIMAGLAGCFFVIVLRNGAFYGTVDGFGFLGLAIMIVGQWRIKFTILASLLFALLFTLGEQISKLTDNQWITTNSRIFKILPFIFSLVTMAAISKWSKPPKAIGEAFDKGKR